MHILLSGPLLIYIGYFKPENKVLYGILLFLGISLGILLFYKISKQVVNKSLTQFSTWYIIHFLIIVPLLIWCGIKHTDTPPIIFSLLMAIGCAAFGYHVIKFIGKIF